MAAFVIQRGGFGWMQRYRYTTVVWLVLLLGAALGVCITAAAEGPRRVALVIGNGRYEHVPRLINPANDAMLIADTLRDLGFELVGGGAQIDLDRGGLERAIRDFSYRLTPGSVGFFYYSGHGIQLRGANFLVPVNANPTSARDADFELVDVNVLLRQMEDSGASLNVVILDACRNNPFGGRGLKDIGVGLAQMQAPRGTVIAYATQPGGVAADGEGLNSPYTSALARLMKRPGLGILDMFNQVAVAVDQATSHSQQPWTALSPITADFYLAGGRADSTLDPASSGQSQDVLRAGPSNPAPASGGADREVVFWQSVQNSRNVAEFEAYVRRFPDGLFVDIAKARIAELKQVATVESGQGQLRPTAPADGPQQALAKIPSAAAPIDMSSPVRIAEVQQLLSGMGFFAGTRDGKLGPRTREAVRAFQISVNTSPDGELSDALLARLRAPPPNQLVRAGALITLAEEAVHIGNITDAMRLYTAGIGLDSANASALVALGDLQKTIGKIDDARRSFSRAAQLGGAMSEEARRRLVSLPQSARSGQTPMNTSAGTGIPPASQPDVPVLPPAAVPGRDVRDSNGPRKIWVVTATSFSGAASVNTGAVSMTAQDPVKEVAVEKALQSCAKYAPFGYASTCRISSEREQDAKQ
jgi:peptidoglycan hydrolase-like protein with peptidoglycan-binding domain